MKKTHALILALSLVANLALAIFLYRATANTPSSPTITRATASPADTAIIATIQTGDPAALITQLKAAGISDKTARYMAASLEFQKFAEQMAALVPEQPYWRNRTPQTPEQRQKMQQIMRTLQTTMTDLLADAMPQAMPNRYPYLTPERRAELRRLEKDYDDLNSEMLAAAGNFRLQSDTDNLKALADARKREIDQFLTPEEITARDLRESTAARLIRNEYGNVIENETEYQAIHAIMAAAAADPASQDAARAQIEATLGPDRMTQLAQLNDPDYQLIQSAAARLNLPPAETTTAMTAIRTQAQELSATIIADKTLTPAEKKNALQDIASKSRTQMTELLGADGAETYAKRSQWMNALKNGSSFTIDTRGKFKTKR